MRLLAAIDFEYKHPAEPGMGLISCSIHTAGDGTESFWLWDGTDVAFLLETIQTLHSTGYTFVGYSIQQAEARCVATLGLDPNTLKWRDPLLEWKWLRNGDSRYSYGRIVRNGGASFTVPPARRVGKKASQEELDQARQENDEYLADLREEFDGMDLAIQEVGWSLLDCCYFFEVLDLQGYREAEATKKRIRDGIIITGTDADIAAHREEILAYNAADVADLLDLAEQVTEAMNSVGDEPHCLPNQGVMEYGTWSPAEIARIQLSIGDWAARLAKYGHRGLPLNRARLERLLKVVPRLTAEIRDSWVKQHSLTPLYRVGLSESILTAKTQPLKASPYIKGEITKDDALMENLIDAYCVGAGLEKYPRTRTGKPDTSKKVIARYASGENLLKAYERHQGNLSALRTFTERDGKVEALDYIGSDFRQRPDYGPYGTQTARNAAKAKSYCFLGAHWLRTLVEPDPGMALVELDFSSQEFFIAGVQGDDLNMQQAYQSADIYMFFAQQTGMYPADLPIPTEEQRSEEWFRPYKQVRNIAKTLTLSMQFGAGPKSVAAAVRDATHDLSITDEQGEAWVADYIAAYADYNSWVQNLREIYQSGTPLALPGGWRMGRDNPSVISASNLPVQGVGSVILQEACRLMDQAGLVVIATLHDAITIQCQEVDINKTGTMASNLMRQAASNILGIPGMKVGMAEIIRNGEVWLHSERAKTVWNQLKQYFEDNDELII
jgi:hypothetical protein